MKKRYVISDIHGNARPFLKLLDHVDPNPEELIILGDLCDRGPDTWGVFEECALLLDEGADIVVGNHDIWFMNRLNGSLDYNFFVSEEVGGNQTLQSMIIATIKHKREKVEAVTEKVLQSMVPYYEDDDYIFVHAGLDPRVPFMDQQKIDTLTMSCRDWKNPAIEHCYSQTVIFGHTPTWHVHRAITEQDARIWSSKRSRKMAIDTGAGFGARLTMLDLKEGIAYAYDFELRTIIEYRFKRSEPNW